MTFPFQPPSFQYDPKLWAKLSGAPLNELWPLNGAKIPHRPRSCRSGRGQAGDLEVAKAAGSLPPELERRHAQHYLDLLDAGSEAVRAYSPQPYPGRVVLFTAAGEAPRSEDETMGWGELVPGLELCRTPGRHMTMLRPPQVELLAARLRDLLDTGRTV